MVGLDEENVEDLARRLTPGDVSVLLYGIESPDSKLMTTAGSANDAFWSALETLGLMEELALPEDVAKELEGNGLTLRFYAVTSRGAAEIPALLERTRKR
jgi:hypothetical protein